MLMRFNNECICFVKDITNNRSFLESAVINQMVLSYLSFRFDCHALGNNLL